MLSVSLRHNKQMQRSKHSNGVANSLTTWRHIRMQKSGTMLLTWCWTCIWMHRIWAHLMHTAKQLAIFFLGRFPCAGQPIKINGAINILCTVLCFFAASAAKAELGAPFHNAKRAKIIRLTLEELGHHQPPTHIHIDTLTIAGIVNNTIKRQKSCSMEICYFWLWEGAIQIIFNFQYHPGFENLADYPSESHSRAHHLAVRPFYVHMPTLSRFLQQAAKPRVQRGCADKLGPIYIHKWSLPSLLVDHTLPAATAYAKMGLGTKPKPRPVLSGDTQSQIRVMTQGIPCPCRHGADMILE